MAATDLGRAMLSLFADPSIRVAIPNLMAMPSTASRAKTFVRFAGDAYPTAFHGEGREGTFSLSARYGPDEAADLLALVELVDEIAPNHPDTRLLLQTHIGLAPGLDVSVAVDVEGALNRTPLPEGVGVVDASFVVRIVQHTFAV